MTPYRILLLVFLVLSNFSIFAQFKIDQLKSDFEQINDSLFLGISETRNIQILNDDWKVFFTDNPKNFSQVSFPVVFTSEESIIFEKKFTLSNDKLVNKFLKLNFLGINYTSEIFINNAAIYKHPGGEIPFSIDLPYNILNYDSPNTLRIKIQYVLDSDNTIPVLQRFLFSKNFGGILRDVYLSFRPKVGIDEIKYNLVDDRRPYEGKLNFNVSLEDFGQIIADSLLENFDGRFKLEASLTTTEDTSKVYFNIWNINPLKKETSSKSFYVRLREVLKWSNSTPQSYLVSIKLTNGDGFVFDEMIKPISFFEFKKRDKELFLNDKVFEINGVAYSRSGNPGTTYKQIESDIKSIKETGFNAVRFSKAFPHPYAVYLCHKYGLFSLVELPLNSVPERFTENNNFENRAESFLKRSIAWFDSYPSVIGYSVGGSYLSNSESHLSFLSKMNSFIKENSQKLTYSSLIGLPSLGSQLNTDIYGIELFASDITELEEYFSSTQFSDSLIYIISEATYPTYKGATSGYLNKFSYEAQAKYFDDVIALTENSGLNGFILGNMYDIIGDYAPLFSGFNEENLYNIGILSNDGNGSSISHNLIKAKLKSSSKVSVPIGSDTEDAPLFFIIAALVISVIIALLINSKRKFREDATRALLRPYNFFADIRDQRILSGFHSNILMFLLAGSNALLLTILLYFFRNNILFEKILIAFGDYKFSSVIGFLAWHPQEAFVYIYIGTIVIFVLLSFFVHLSSFFVKTRVLYSSVYSVAIWAFLPLALLLPIEAVLFKILLTGTYNNIVFIILILFFVWNLQRLLKGIYVIFDVRPLFVYSYAFLTIIILLSAFGLYYQYTVSAFDYISLAIKQYILL